MKKQLALTDYMTSACCAACDPTAKEQDWKFAATEYFGTARQLGLQPLHFRPVPRMHRGKYKDWALVDIAKQDKSYLHDLLERKTLGEEFRADIRRALTEGESLPPDRTMKFRQEFKTGAAATLHIDSNGYSVTWNPAVKSIAEIQAIHEDVGVWLVQCAHRYEEETGLRIACFWTAVPTQDPLSHDK